MEPYQTATTSSPTVEDVLALLNLVRHLASVLIVDVPYYQNELFFSVISLADQVVLRRAEGIIGSFPCCGPWRPTTARTHRSADVGCDRYDLCLRKLDAKHLSSLLEVSELETVRNDYRVVSSASNNGWSLRQEAPESVALADIDRLASKIMGLPVPHAAHYVRDRMRHLWHQMWR